MEQSMTPEDEKFVESLKKLIIADELIQKQLEEQKIAKAAADDDEDSQEDENRIVIPEEQKIEPAERIEPAKSTIPPEYVKKVVRELDSMSTPMLKEALARIRVSESGTRKQLRKRVAMYYRRENMMLNQRSERNNDRTSRYFDYLIAIDFECTCVEVIFDYPHEIIELPAVLIDTREMKIISEFRTYVRPVRNPILSEFCMEFTKISQETVDNAPYFREALQRLYAWMRKFGLGEKNARFAFVTDGPHDFWKFMQFQCLLSNVRMPHMFRSFINIKKTFKEKFNGLVKGNGKSGIENMLEGLGLTFRGNKHSGLDDARNIATIAIEMMRRKIELRINQKCTYKENQHSIKEHDEDLEDTAELGVNDMSRRDFQMWMRKLPMKLLTVTRREFLHEEYLDCDSCDDLVEEKETEESRSLNMEIRRELEKAQAEEFEKLCEKNGRFKIGEIKEKSEKTEVPEGFEDSEDDDDYAADMESLIQIANTEGQENIELNTIWERNRLITGIVQEDPSLQEPPMTGSSTSNSSESGIPQRHYSPRMVSSTTSSGFPMVPKNSLASSNRRYPY